MFKIITKRYSDQPILVMTHHVTKDTSPPRVVPQIRSIKVISGGQSFRVARFVRSYVAYVTSPKNIPPKRAYFQLCFSRAGDITKNTSPAR
jgi:hypothetical protein